MSNNRELLALLVDMTKATRCCQQDSVFCGGITFTQFFILDQIDQHGTLRLSDLHDILSVEKSTSTRLIQPLVRKGLVKKDRSESDSRAINLTVTDRGRQINAELWRCFDSFFEELTAEIPKDIREEVLKHVIVFVKAVRNVFSKSSCC